MEIISHPQLHQDIGRWVDLRIPGDHVRGFGPNVTAIGFVENGKPVGGVTYYNFTGYNILAAIAIEPKFSLPRRALRAIFHYPFVQLGCLRITALIGTKNVVSMDFCVRLGFKYEGTLRRATPTDDHLIYGLIKEECRWIPRAT